MIFEIENFKAKIGFHVKYYYGSHRTCFGVYNEIDDFQIKFTMQMKWMECYKDVIESLWCLDNWTGKYAKIF